MADDLELEMVVVGFIIAAFFVTFFPKSMFNKIFFTKMTLYSQKVKMLIQYYNHIRHIMHYHFEKGWNTV